MSTNIVPVRQEVTAESLASLLNTCAALSAIKNDKKKYFEQAQPIGSTLQIKRPWKPVGYLGQQFQPESIVQTTVPLTISYVRQVSWIYNDTDEALFLDMENYHDEYSRPAGIALANLIDGDLLQYMQLTTPNYVGSAGTLPTDTDAYTLAQSQLDMLLAESNDRNVIYTSEFNQKVVKAQQTLFNDQKSISKMYLSGYQGRFASFDFFVDNQIPTFTNGTWVGSGQASSTGQMGSTLTLNNFTGSSVSLVPGMRFTIDGVYKVNPQGARTAYTGTANLLQFVVTQAAVDTSGTVSVNVYPPLIPAGPFQNASAATTSGSAVTFVGTTGSTYRTAFAVQKDAYCSAFISLMKPPNVECETMSGSQFQRPGGPSLPDVSIRSIKQWQSAGPYANFMTESMMVMYGFCAQYADYKSVVILG